jgi:hypothetical protein
MRTKQPSLVASLSGLRPQCRSSKRLILIVGIVVKESTPAISTEATRDLIASFADAGEAS